MARLKIEKTMLDLWVKIRDCWVLVGPYPPCTQTSAAATGIFEGGVGNPTSDWQYRTYRKIRITKCSKDTFNDWLFTSGNGIINISRDQHAIARDDLSDKHLSLHFRSPINTDEARAILVCHHIHGKVHIKITVCSRRRQLWCQMFHRTADARIKCKCSI